MILKMNVILTLITVLIANDFCFGQNYGTVPGPTSYDAKIIIAGGGIPGITMARELAMSNFTNVTVYEGSPLIGSKFGSTERRGTTFHNMWQIPISDDSEIMELAQQYLPESDIIKEPQPVILAYEEDMSNYKEYSIADYLIAYTMKMNVDINRVDAINHFVDDTLRYKRFHENVLQISADGAYIEPTDQTLSSLQQTVSEFLTEYSIESLKSVFLLQMTLQGSGHPDDTPLLYGLKEVTPKVMDMYGDLINSTDESETSHDFNSYMLKNGYVGLFNEIIEKHKIKVVKNTAVDRLRQQSSFSNTKNQVRLRQMMQGNFEYKYEDADFVVWAENLRSSIMARSFNNQRDYSLKEYNAFLQPKMEIYRHHNLIEMTNITRASSPIMIFIDELMNKGNGVAMLYDTYAVLNMVSKDSYTTGDYSKNADQSNYTTYQSIHITYDYGIVSSYDNLNRLNPQELTEVENMKFKTEGLFSKRSISDGISWNLRDLQGANGMWFVDETMQKTSPTRRNNLNKVLLQNLQPIITESEVSSLIPTSSFSYVTTFVSKSFDVVSSTVQAFTTASFHSMSSMRISSSLKIEPTGTISSMDMKSTGKMSSMLDSTHSMKVVPTHMMSSMDMKSSETMSIMIGSTHSMKVRSTHTMSSMDMKSSETMSRMLDSTHSMKVEPTHMMSSMDMKSSETMSSMLDGTHSMKVEPTHMMSSMDMKSSETMSRMLDSTHSMKVEPTHMMSSMDMKSSETMSSMLDGTHSMKVDPTHMMSSMDMKSSETMSSMLDGTHSMKVEPTHMMSSMDMKSSETMSRMLDSTHSMKVEPTHMMSSMDMKSSETMSSMLDGTHSMKVDPTHMMSSMDMKSSETMSRMLDGTHSMKVEPTNMMSSMDMKSSETMSSMLDVTYSMKVESTHMMSSMDMKSSETMSRMLDATYSMNVEPTHMMSSMDMKSSETMSRMLDGTHSMKVEPTNMMSSMDMKSSETMSSMLDVTYSMKVESTHMMSSMDMKSSETMSRMLDATYSMNVEPTHMMSSMDMKSYETLSSMLDASPSINVEATHMMSSMGDEPQSSHMSELGVVDATNVMPSMLINTVTGSEHLQMTKSLRSAPTMSVMFSEVLHSHHQTTESQRSSNTPILAA